LVNHALDELAALGVILHAVEDVDEQTQVVHAMPVVVERAADVCISLRVCVCVCECGFVRNVQNESSDAHQDK
jgi:hypothetical protein